MKAFVSVNCDFNEKLEGLFDIASKLALKNDSTDAKLILLKHRNEKRQKKNDTEPMEVNENERYEEEFQPDMSTQPENVKNESSSTSASSSQHTQPSSQNSVTSDDFYEPPAITGGTRYQKIKTPIISDDLLQALDRSKVSDRKAALIVTTLAVNSDCDMSKTPVSRSSIKRKREKVRESTDLKLKSSFNPEYPLTVHWDGKLMESLSSSKKVERLPILITSGDTEQLLEVPSLQNATGINIATAVSNTLKKWKIEERVTAMCYDTTASNTGNRNGACVQLENILQRNLLHLSCRHHIFEILLEAAFSISFGPSKSPDIPIFSRFKASWDKINLKNIQTYTADEKTRSITDEERLVLLEYANKYLSDKQPRDDYKELLELIITFLGGRVSTFKAPGAVHRARWMARAIYSLKIWILQKEFTMSIEEKSSLTRICLFVSMLYFVPWYNSPLAIPAPRLDLELVKNVLKYKQVDEEIAEAVLKKLCRHLWYLSEELICFSFFDENVSISTKREMVKALSHESQKKRAVAAEVDTTAVINQELHTFVNRNSLNFFKITGIDSSFLDEDPSQWETNNTFIQAKKICECMKVINDPAERGVALAQEFNKLHTKNEKQKQSLLLQVHKHRKELPLLSKKNICEKLKKRKN